MTERDFELLDLLCQEIEERGVDIAPTYSEWVTVTYGLATDFGEEGREAFHRICRQYADGYSQEANDKMYTYALAHNRMKVHFGSILLLARRAGVDTEALRGRMGGGRGTEVRRTAGVAGATGPGVAGQGGAGAAAPVGPGATEQGAYGVAGATGPGAAGQDGLGAAAPVGPGAAIDAGAKSPNPRNPDTFSTRARVRQGVTDVYRGAYGQNGDDPDDVRVAGSEPLAPLPTLYEGSYAWPRPLALALEADGGSTAYRDVLLLGSLTALGASLGRAAATEYSAKMQYANLQTFVVAPPASGKGILSFVRHIVDPIHQEIRRQNEQERRKYEAEKAAWERMGNRRSEVEPPQAPPLRMFFLPGNVTGTGILQLLIDNGGRGFIFEVEADTVSAAIHGDYGQWSDALRKCFENEALSYFRRTGQEYKECDHTFLSVLLSGTPGQVAPLIPSAENGLFSRQVFYYMPGVKEFISQFHSNDRELVSHFKRLGAYYSRYHRLLMASGNYQLKLRGAQQEEFNRVFDELFKRSVRVNDAEMNSSVVRLAINCLRMILIVALLRATEPTFRHIEQSGEAPRKLLFEPTLMEPTGAINQQDRPDGKMMATYQFFVDDDDFHQVLAMARPLFEHALHVLSLLDRTSVSRRTISDRDAFFAALPQAFTMAQAKVLAGERGLTEKRVEHWIYNWRDKGLLQATAVHGGFQKQAIE